MRKIGILGLVGVLALVLAGCGGGYSAPPAIVTGPGLVGLDDSSDATAPLLTVTYTVPATTIPVTVQYPERPRVGRGYRLRSRSVLLHRNHRFLLRPVRYRQRQ